MYFSQVLDRVMQILDCFSDHEPELSFMDLVNRLELNRSTLYRLLEAMRNYRLVELDRSNAKYHLGIKLFELGSLSIKRFDINRYAGPFLEMLVKQTGETAHLCVLDGSDILYIAKVESTQALRIPSSVGRKNPAYCTGVGKAILAHLSEGELQAYLAQTDLKAFTRKTLVSPADLMKDLRVSRSRGYSVDNEEITENTRCIGAPIRDHTGQVIAAISIAGPSFRITKEKVPILAAYVIEAADAISMRAGYRRSSVSAVAT
jgi:IclR family KDG regulon transcriptional repressor